MSEERLITPFFEFDQDESGFRLYRPLWSRDPFWATAINAVRSPAMLTALLLLGAAGFVVLTVILAASENKNLALLSIVGFAGSVAVLYFWKNKLDTEKYDEFDTRNIAWDRFMIVAGRLPKHWGKVWKKTLGKQSGSIVGRYYWNVYEDLVAFSDDPYSKIDLYMMAQLCMKTRQSTIAQLDSMNIRDKSYPSAFLLLLSGIEPKVVRRLDEFGVNMNYAVQQHINGESLESLFDSNPYDIDPHIMGILNDDIMGLVKK